MLSRKLKNCLKSPLRKWGSPCAKRPDYGPLELQRTSLLNGIKVTASKTMGHQIAAYTIMFQAGSRCEVDNQLGATHFLRAMSNAPSAAYTAFMKMRYLPQNGCYMTCTSDRQTVSYSLRCPFHMFHDVKYYLLDSCVRCSFEQHDIDDRKALIQNDLHRITPEQRALDLVQRAAWAGPLGNSMFCEEERIESMTSENLRSFVAENFKSSHCSIASVGVPLDESLRIAEQINVNREPPPKRKERTSCFRRSIEHYDLGPGSDTCVALVVPGCGFNDLCVLLAYNVIAAACGTGAMQTGQHHTDRTLQVPLGYLATDLFMEFRAFNISYSNQGLFGILVKSPSHLALNAAYGAVEFLTRLGGLDCNQLEIGRQRLKLNLALNEENCVRLTDSFALQASIDTHNKFDSAAHAMTMLDELSLDQISQVARDLANNSRDMSAAVVGDVEAVPLDL